MATTNSERGLTLRSPGRFMAAADRLADLCRATPTRSDRDTEDVAQAWIDAQAYQAYTLEAVTKMVDGEQMGAASSMNKIFWSEMDVRIHEAALNMLGASGELDDTWMKGYQFALAGPIYAGTNEIQRNVVAERVLGLPRK